MRRSGDAPTRGAVGFRGEGREYPGGYGRDTDEFAGGMIDDSRAGPPDDEGFDPGYGRARSGLGAFGSRDPDDPEIRSDREGERPIGAHRGRGPKGYRRSDERIREDVCERLTEDPFIDASIATDLDTVKKDRFLIGGPDQVVRDLRPFVERYGATHLICRLFFPGMPHARIMRALELIAREVRPAFA